MINAKVGRGTSDDLRVSLEEATKDFINPKLIIYYTSKGKFKEFSELLYEKFPNAVIIGASAYKEICKDGLTNGALLAMSYEDGIECYAGVMEDIEKYPVKHIQKLQDCVNKMDDLSNTICLEFCVGTTNSEERVLSTLNSLLHVYEIPLFGGTSADDGEFETTYVGLNGKIYDNHCVFVLIRNISGKIKVYQENIYKKTPHTFVATKVDEKERIVYELDQKPCAEVMSNTLKTNVSKLPELFSTHPLGRIVGDNVYISANKTLIENKAISYYSRIYKNSKVALLEPDDYRKVLKSTLGQIKKDFSHISCAVVVNCVARTMFFEQEGFADTFAKELGQLGTYIGFASHGEQMNDYHFNQTMLICVFE